MPRQAEIKTIDVVALVLQNHQGEILIQQRKQGTHLAGKWEFPGGKVEANETLLEALNREIQEELDYTPTNPVHLITLKHQYPEKKIKLIVFFENSEQPKVTNAENQPLRWVPIAMLDKIDMPEADLPILKSLQQI